MKRFFIGFITVILILAAVAAILFFGGSNLFARASLKPKAVDLTNIAKTSAISAPLYAYEVVEQSSYITLKPGEKSTLTLKIKNIGNTTWQQTGEFPVYLATSRPDERVTQFYTKGLEGWISGDRIRFTQSSVAPGETAEFVFTVVASKNPGIYREYFRPVVEHVQWLSDLGVYWDITVPSKDPKANLTTYVSGKPEKYILVDISEQRLKVYENGLEKYSFVTSTGRSGMDTPIGEFTIHNKYPTAYSKPFDLYMDNWMAITADGEYGLHSLPYWKLKTGGRLYEGEEHLGTRVSHGCIRTGLEQSKILYEWARVGTKVYIQN
ncbi:MAG: L,D-transpeptidase family protein [Patescibacteria group bacterium]